MTHFKTGAAFLAITVLLSACGGGGSSTEDNQQITSVTVRALAYSRSAVLVVSGAYLRSSMVATTGACKDPVFNMSQSTPELAVLNCIVTATGEQPLTITGINGKVLYTGTVTVPQPQVELATSQGNVVLELNPAAAPLSVNNFLSYVNSGFYSGTLFHRVIPGFAVQGGGYTPGLIKKAGQLAPIALESNNGLSNTRGTLAMARTSVPDSATSEFYVNLVDNRGLDYQSPTKPGYAVFGKVVNGLDVIDKIAVLQTASINGFADVPVTDVTLELALQIK
jgi:peptidyl-prolyl cis-trans isomerase A (cyclophilin A)